MKQGRRPSPESVGPRARLPAPRHADGTNRPGKDRPRVVDAEVPWSFR